MSREAIEDRRQRVLDVFIEEYGGTIPEAEAAIGMATRVKITEEAIDCVEYARDFRDGLAASLAELGFEVED